MNSKKGQVWIETVVYILIGLALIAIVLAFVMPRINEEKNKAIVEQTIKALSVLDDKINEVIDAGIENRRIVDFSMRVGELYITKVSEVVFVLKDLNEPYSEPGVKIPVGRIIVETIEGKKSSSVNLTLQYWSIANLTFDGKEETKKFSSSSIPYRFSIENKGLAADNIKYNVEIRQVG